MVHTVLKPKDEIFGLLEGISSLFVIRCGFCASFCGTGRYSTFRAMREMLAEKSIGVTSDGDQSKVDGACALDLAADKLEKEKTRILSSDAIGMLCCGSGVMSMVRMARKLGIKKPVIPLCDTIGVGMFGYEAATEKREVFCATCSTCVLGITGGVCPQSICTRHLRKPCKKIEDLKPFCEYDETNSCIFYELNRDGLLEELLSFERRAKQERVPAFVCKRGDLP